MHAAAAKAGSHLQVSAAGPAVEATLLGAIAGGAEGLMLKFLDSRCAYEPSRRADSWLKLKKDYCEGLRDSLDLVRPCTCACNYLCACLPLYDVACQ